MCGCVGMETAVVRDVCIEFFSSPHFPVFHGEESLTSVPPPDCYTQSEQCVFVCVRVPLKSECWAVLRRVVLKYVQVVLHHWHFCLPFAALLTLNTGGYFALVGAL